MSLNHSLAQSREVAWEDLLDKPLFLMRHATGLRTLADKAFSKWSKRVKPAYEVSQVATGLDLVAEVMQVAEAFVEHFKKHAGKY